MRYASLRTPSGGLLNSPLPNVIEHTFRVAICGFTSTSFERSSSATPRPTPVESCTSAGHDSSIRPTVRRAISRSAVGRWSASRRWTCTTAAPAACASFAAAAISSGVTGSAAFSAFVASGPVRAVVNTAGFMGQLRFRLRL
jgi:hypothetical protein